jgi:translation elongation factor EF-4
MLLEIFSPTDFYGTVMIWYPPRAFLKARISRAQPRAVDFEIPLSELIVDSSMILNRARGIRLDGLPFLEYRTENLVKLEILVNNEPLTRWAHCAREDAITKDSRW